MFRCHEEKDRVETRFFQANRQLVALAVLRKRRFLDAGVAGRVALVDQEGERRS